MNWKFWQRKTKKPRIFKRETDAATILQEFECGKRFFEHTLIHGDLDLSKIPVMWLSFNGSHIKGSLKVFATDIGIERPASVGVFDSISFSNAQIDGDLSVEGIMDGTLAITDTHFHGNVFLNNLFVMKYVWMRDSVIEKNLEIVDCIFERGLNARDLEIKSFLKIQHSFITGPINFQGLKFFQCEVDARLAEAILYSKHGISIFPDERGFGEQARSA